MEFGNAESPISAIQMPRLATLGKLSQIGLALGSD
jgi:hypothetical protein